MAPVCKMTNHATVDCTINLHKCKKTYIVITAIELTIARMTVRTHITHRQMHP